MFTRKPILDRKPESTKIQPGPTLQNTQHPPHPPHPRASAAAAHAVAPPTNSAPNYDEGLIVIGKGTRVNGRIGDCRTLDVHGIVEADVVADMLIVRAGGGIKGTVQTDNAQVHGVLEGTLIVHEHLDIRSTGQVTGDVGYRTLAIEAGAQLRGNIQCSEPDPHIADATTPDTAGNVVPMVGSFDDSMEIGVATTNSVTPLFPMPPSSEKGWTLAN